MDGNSVHFPGQICWLHPKQEERRTLSSKAVEKEKVIWQCFYLIYLFIQQGFIKCSCRVSGNKQVSFSRGCTNARGSGKESANKTKQPSHFPLETNGSQKLEAGGDHFSKGHFSLTVMLSKKWMIAFG